MQVGSGHIGGHRNGQRFRVDSKGCVCTAVVRGGDIVTWRSVLDDGAAFIATRAVCGGDRGFGLDRDRLRGVQARLAE